MSGTVGCPICHCPWRTSGFNLDVQAPDPVAAHLQVAVCSGCLLCPLPCERLNDKGEKSNTSHLVTPPETHRRDEPFKHKLPKVPSLASVHQTLTACRTLSTFLKRLQGLFRFCPLESQVSVMWLL